MQAKIATWLLKVGAVTLRPSNPFTWSSGIKSPIYCDNRLLISNPHALQDVIQGFLSVIRKRKIKCDAIAGVATAGIPYAAILADRLKKPMLYVRNSAKDHGKKNQVEGSIEKGARVLVIEDLVSTGRSSLNAISVLREAGTKVDYCLAVFTYGFPETKKAFLSARCKLFTLTCLDPLLEIALRQKIIKPEEEKIIRSFVSSRA